MPYKINYIMEKANRYDIPVIEDAVEGFGSHFNGQMLGVFGKYGVLLLNGNKMMITTSGGDTSITDNENKWREIGGMCLPVGPYVKDEDVKYNVKSI